MSTDDNTEQGLVADRYVIDQAFLKGKYCWTCKANGYKN